MKAQTTRCCRLVGFAYGLENRSSQETVQGIIAMRSLTPDFTDIRRSKCSIARPFRQSVVAYKSGTDLGENVRHKEVSDEEATKYVLPGVQTARRLLGARPRSLAKGWRVAQSASARRYCVAGCNSFEWNARESRRRARRSRRINSAFKLEARIERLVLEKAILKTATAP